LQDKESSSKTKLVKYGDRSELDQEMDRFALLIEGLCGEKDGQGGIQSEGTSGVPAGMYLKLSSYIGGIGVLALDRSLE
jgi:hypothetical protein